MQHTLNKIVSIALATAAFSACVRHRPVERKLDFDGDRWEKAIFANGQEWLGTVTIVNNGSNQAFGMVGSQAETRIGHFNFTKDKLQFLSADTFVNPQSKEKRVINEWKITHSEYHQKVSGGRVSNIETENQDISWKDKRYFKVDWSEASISESNSFPWEVDKRCWTSKSSRVDTDATDIGADHIDFTVVVTYERNLDGGEDCYNGQVGARDLTTNQVAYKYSFMPDFKSDYVPYVYTGETDPLMKKYGYFTTVTTTVDEFRRSKNVFMMNRWNPNKTHTIYFAKGFPEQYKWIYADPEIGVIARTNKLFAENNLPLRFEVKDADEQHQFGDIRYSFFNFVEDDDDSAPLGYGPSVAHPRTGEIISANTTIWTSMLKYYVKLIRDHVKRQDGGENSSSLLAKMDDMLNQPSDLWAEASSSFLASKAASEAFRYAIPDFTYGRQGNPYANELRNQGLLTSKQDIPFLSEATAKTPAFSKLHDIEMSVEASDKRLNGVSELQKFKRSQVRFLDSEGISRLRDVAPEMSDEEIINDILYRVAIHEFGHNLNLRHNFYGSVDAALNREKTAKHGLKVATASVMDYLDLKDELDQAQDWEPYDKAALLFAYSSGALDEAKRTGHVHLFCTDEHLFSNPLCNQFDSGATPTEVLKSVILSYDDNFSRRNFRDGRAFWDLKEYDYRQFMTMYTVKKFLNLLTYAYKPADLQRVLGTNSNLTEDGKTTFINGIQADMKEAVKLAMAFYASVIDQSNNERPFTEVYDSWSGGLKYKGIFSDKVFAARFLLSRDGVAFDPNQGPYLMSFAQLLDGPNADDELKKFTKEVLENIFTEVGDGYVGFSTMVRVNAILGTEFQKGSATAYEAGRFGCYTAESLKTRFGVDTKSFKDKEALLIDDMTQVRDPYYSSQTQLAIRPIDGRYYVAGKDSNFLAYALLNKSNLDATDMADVRELHNYFYLFAEGRAAECQ